MQLGVVALGTYLRGRGFSARVIDQFLTIPEFEARARAALRSRPLAVGFSTTFVTSPETVRRVRGLVREESPSSFFILGGHSAERRPEFGELADLVVEGPGERALAEALESLKAGRLPRGPRAKAVFPVTEIPAPDWSLLDALPLACLPVEGSRGCRYDCAFCTFPERGGQTQRDPVRVAEEVGLLQERYGIGLFRFVDSNFTSFPDWVLALCAHLRRRAPESAWACYARPDDFHRHPEMIEAMAGAGCSWVYSGIESGNEAILRSMRKGYTRAQVQESVRRLKDSGIRVHGNFIIGFPGETQESVGDTLDLVLGSRLDTVAFYLLNLPDGGGSTLVEEPERFGLTGLWQTWRHKTMDSDAAREHVKACIDAVCRQGRETYIGSEFLMSFYLRGRGLTEGEGFDCLGAYRDYHLAAKDGDPDLAGRALARIAGYEERMEEFSRRRTREGLSRASIGAAA